MKLKIYFQSSLLVLVLILSGFTGHAQGEFLNDLRNTIRIPNSPEAEAFMKYGDYSVNLYSGTPDISIPLHTFQGRESNLPLELTYDASGIKVNQLATSAGLGWNLKLGGRISRITNGAPDDYINQEGPAYYTVWDNLPTASGTTIASLILKYANNDITFPSQLDAIEYLDFLRDVDKGEIDTQLDFFSVNVADINVFVVLNLSSRTFRVLDNHRIKAEATFTGTSLDSWTITGEDGTRYYFEYPEKTKVSGDDWQGSPFPGGNPPYGLIRTYNSSWLLTRMVSPNGLDDYRFTYTSLGMTEEGSSLVSVQSTVNDLSDLGSPGVVSADSETRFQPTTEVEVVVPDIVKHNQSKIFEFDHKARTDYAGWNNGIDLIKIYESDDMDPYRQIRFNHTYFGAGNGPLKLDGITFLNEAGLEYGQKYLFNYINPDVTIGLADQDYLGYYNGAGNGDNLIPRYELESGNDVWTFPGANRTPNFSKSIARSLYSITYPTGGKTEFTYESHGDRSGSSEIVSVTRHYHYLQGSEGDPFACQPECDQWSVVPTISTKVIRITESKNYDIAVSLGDHEARAYLHKLNNNVEVAYSELSSLSEYGSWTNNNPVTLNIPLDEGYYQITLANANPATTSTLYINEDVRRTVPGEPLAGQRIQSIKNYDASNNFLSGKEYKYVTRRIIREPSLLDFPKAYADLRQDFNEPKTSLVRYSQAPGLGHVPHIAYQEVLVAERSSLSEFGTSTYSNGYTKHNFEARAKGWQVFDGISHYFADNVQATKEISSSVFPATSLGGSPIEHTERTYSRKPVFSYSVKVPRYNPERFPHIAVIYPSLENGTNVYRIMTVAAVGSCFDGGSSCDRNLAPIACEIPNDNGNFWDAVVPNLRDQVSCEMTVCDADELYCYGTSAGGIVSSVGQRVATLQTRPAIVSGYYDYLKSSTRTYSAQGTNEQLVEINETHLTSDALPDGNIQLMDFDNNVRSRTRTTSDGAKDSVVFYYARDQEGAVYNAMKNDNQLTKVIESRKYKKYPDNTEALQETYRLNHVDLGGRYLPSSREIAIGDLPLEVREVFVYNNRGNVREAETIEEPGVKQAFLWSYNNRFMVAHIKNVDYATVETTLTPSTINYIEQSNLSETELFELLRPLYAIPGAYVTLYAHKPGRGISSVINPNQLRTYYKYDEEGRLHKIVDDEGNIRQQYEYNFTNQ